VFKPSHELNIPDAEQCKISLSLSHLLTHHLIRTLKLQTVWLLSIAQQEPRIFSAALMIPQQLSDQWSHSYMKDVSRFWIPSRGRISETVSYFGNEEKRLMYDCLIYSFSKLTIAPAGSEKLSSSANQL